MDIKYYRDARNFGDRLNEVIWPKLVLNMEELYGDTPFYGVGSVLGTSMVDLKKSGIIFGAGCRGLPVSLGQNLKVSFVRGPLTGALLGGHVRWLADAAYALRLLSNEGEQGRANGGLVFMPHYSSVTRLPWRKLAAEAGFQVLFPDCDVEDGLRVISTANAVVSEAMHGCIVADAMRVPWCRVKLFSHQSESRYVSEFKWMDWLSSIHMSRMPDRELCFSTASGSKWVTRLFAERAFIGLLKSIRASGQFFLSKEITLNAVEEEMAKELEYLNSGKVFEK